MISMTSGKSGRNTPAPDLFPSSCQGRSCRLTANDEYSVSVFSKTTAMSDDERASLTSIQSLHASPNSITSKPAEFPHQAQS